jgi:REP element-mobilizing transposase RayT
MARPLRIEYPGAFYHVMNRGLERRDIFHHPKDYESFLNLCLEIHKRFKIIFHTYSLMPNHYHLMVETPEKNLSRAMRHLNGVYTQGFNKSKRRVGPLFQGRYKAILVDKEAYSLQLCRYIHLNPVKAKIVSRPEEHDYSSFRYYLGRGGKAPEFLEMDWLLGQFGRREHGAKESFYQFTMNGLKDGWEPGEGLRGGMILGGEDFFERIRNQHLVGKEDREIPHLKKSQRIPGMEGIRSCVESCCEEIGLRKRLLVWTLKRYTPLKLREIAGSIQNLKSPLSYSAVSQIYRRVEKERQENKKLQKLIGQIESEMSNVKT